MKKSIRFAERLSSKFCLVPLALFVISCLFASSPLCSAEKPAGETALRQAVFDCQEWRAGNRSDVSDRWIVSDWTKKKLYVGIFSYDTKRQNLWVFDLKDDRNIVGKPRSRPGWQKQRNMLIFPKIWWKGVCWNQKRGLR